jgi:hypothetical protein
MPEWIIALLVEQPQKEEEEKEDKMFLCDPL